MMWFSPNILFSLDVEAGISGFTSQQDVFLSLVLLEVKQRQNYLQLYILCWKYLSLFQYYCIIKAHREFLVSASAVVWLLEMGNWPKAPELLLLLMWACRTDSKTQTQRRAIFFLTQ